MKRILACLILVLLFAGTAFAEEIDLATMTDEELLKLQDEVETELRTRGATGTIIESGSYITGVDIKEGSWRLTNIGGNESIVGVVVFDSPDDYATYRELTYGNSEERQEAPKYFVINGRIAYGNSMNISLHGEQVMFLSVNEGATCIIQEANNSFAP